MTSPATNNVFTGDNEYFQPVAKILDGAVQEQGTNVIDLDMMAPDEYYKLQSYVDYADIVE